MLLKNYEYKTKLPSTTSKHMWGMLLPQAHKNCFYDLSKKSKESFVDPNLGGSPTPPFQPVTKHLRKHA